MRVLVDTPVWSLALRRKQTDLSAAERHVSRVFEDLIRDGRAQIFGPVRQELLSGIRQEERFQRIRDELRAFDEPALEPEVYEEAAQMTNRCRAQGIAGSAIDFLICAVSQRRNWEIFTTDNDFRHYARILLVKLYAPA